MEEGGMRMASALLVAAAAAASAWNTHRNGFVWDDRSAVVANKDVRADRALWEVFTHDFWGAPISSIDSHKSYRPLTVLSFRLNFWTSGGDISSALHFHVGNMLIHVGCSLLVWKVAQALFLKQYQPQQQDQKFSGPQTLYFKRMGATLAALLFAVHPIHCDAVASVVGRADLLCTMLSLLAFLSYVDAVEHQGRTKWSAFILAIVYAVAASLCKELGFTVFGLFLAYDLITQLSSHHNGHSYITKQPTMNDATSQRTAALVLVTLALTITRVWINGEHGQMQWNLLANNVVVQSSKWTRVLSYAHIHAWYLWKLLWPRSLCFDYGFKTIPLISTIWDLYNLYTLVAYNAVATGVYMGVKQLPTSPVLLMSIVFGVVPFIPASNLLFPVGTVVAERLLYFPSVGFCLLVGHVLQSALAISYKYGSADLLQSRTAEDDGSKLNTVVHLTKPLKDAFRRCYALITLCAWSLLLCGCYRSQLRNAEWADETTLFSAALLVSPTNNKVLSNIGKTLLGSDNAQTIRILRVATAIVPHEAIGHTNLGLAHWNLKHTLFAARHLAKSNHFSGDRFQPTGYLGGALFDHWMDEHQANSGGFTPEMFHSSPTIQKARRNMDLAIANNSYYPIHYYTRAQLAYFGSEFEDAVRLCERTLQVNDAVLKKTIDTELLLRVGQIYNLMAISYSGTGRKDLALEAIAKGLSLEPNEVDLHANAAMLYADRRDAAKGNEHLKDVLRLSTVKSVPTLAAMVQHLETMGEPTAAAVCRDRIVQLTGGTPAENVAGSSSSPPNSNVKTGAEKKAF